MAMEGITNILATSSSRGPATGVTSCDSKPHNPVLSATAGLDKKNPACNFPHRHKKVHKIGEGSQGDVFTYFSISTKQLVVVKTVKRTDDIPREAKFLMNLPHHESIVRMYGYHTHHPTPDFDSLVLEYCPNGDLWELNQKEFAKNLATYSEGFMWAIFRQLISATAFLHEGIGCKDSRKLENWHPIIHRDIKMENILVSDLGTKDDFSDIKIKLCDFGFSAFCNPDDGEQPDIWGACIFWPPEQNFRRPLSTPAGDVWAVGCVLHELAHGFPPVDDPAVCRLKRSRVENVQAYDDTFGELVTYFWDAETQRRVLPINLEPDEHAWDRRRCRPTPKYSDELNSCFVTALELDFRERFTAPEMLTLIEEKEAALQHEHSNED